MPDVREAADVGWSWLRKQFKRHKLGAWLSTVAAGITVTVISAWLIGAFSDDGLSGEPFTAAVAWSGPEASWVVDSPAPRAIPTAPSDVADVNRWLHIDGVRTDQWEVLVTVQGTAEAQVTITDVRARIVERRPPAEGTFFVTPEGGRGRFRWFAVNLDESPARVTQMYDEEIAQLTADGGDVSDPEVRPYDMPYTVSLTEAETFRFQPTTESCDCSWTLEMTSASQGQTGTAVIDDHGEPFRTTSTANVIRECNYRGDRWENVENTSVCPYTHRDDS